MAEIQNLTRAMLPELLSFWRSTFPLPCMDEFLIEERVFGPPGARPEQSLCLFDDHARMIALSLLVPPTTPDKKTGATIGGIRWFGVHPDCRGKGLGTALIEESCRLLRETGAERVDFLSTPPYYIRPGVDTRRTDVIAWLLRRGFERYGVFHNMTVDLEVFTPSPENEIFASDGQGYSVRRATAGDREALAAYCLSDWTANWKAEILQGLDHDPVSIFLAVKSEIIAGFAAYEVNQGLGSFGPTGVSAAHRGLGLGRRLFFAALADMKTLGRPHCDIGWVGPVAFYHRAAGAALGPIFWGMRKRLDSG